MSNKDVILKSVQYIENNLKSEITVFSVAREVCYSLYHFIRLFQSVTGYSPKNYIQHRRLTEAVYEIRDTDKKISDIAYEFQFGSPETFTRAFKKQFSINPTDIRNRYSLANLLLAGPISADYIYQSDKVRAIPPELINLAGKTLAGISFFISDQVEINDLSNEWNRFKNEVHTIEKRIIPERYFQVQFWSENQDIGGLYFFIGVEISEIEDMNPLFVIKKIPAGKYLKFIHRGLSNKIGYTYKYIYNQFLPETDYRLSCPFNFEFYGEKCLGPYNEKSESEIFIPVE